MHCLQEADLPFHFICMHVGIAGLTPDPSHNALHTLLQFTTIQAGGDDDTTLIYTQIVAFNVSSFTSSSTVANATSSGSQTETGMVTSQWVVLLPTSKKGKTQATR